MQLTPVSLITGFLGSGKTTLLNELIHNPELNKVVVLINEFGEVGLDHHLVETVSEDIILLQSGCICCQIRDDLVTTLTDLFDKRESGEIEAFTRVLIETTGVADPTPVIQVLISDQLLSQRFRLETTVTLVDCVFGESQLPLYPEALKQVALADKVLLTKSDLVDEAAVNRLRHQIEQINYSAPIHIAMNGVIEPRILFEEQLIDSGKAKQQLKTIEWLKSHTQDAERTHSHGISSISVTLSDPIEWDSFSEWLDSLVFSRAENILRIKGILNVAGKDKPVVIQGVQHMFYSPSTLKAWPTTDRRSRLVFITFQFNPQAIKASLEQFMGANTNKPIDHKMNTLDAAY